MKNNNILTKIQTYRAMQFFIEDYYYKTNSSDLGSLLGSMQLFPEGGTFDPAIWNEWLDSVNDKKNLTLLEELKSVNAFLKIYYSYVESEDIKNLIELTTPEENGNINKIIWDKWQDSVKQTLSNNIEQ